MNAHPKLGCFVGAFQRVLQRPPLQDAPMQSRYIADLAQHGSLAADADASSAGEQPLTRRAALAVALAPVLVLLALTLVIGDLVEAYLGLGGVALSVAWLVLEMHQVQRAIARQEAETDFFR